MAGPTPERFRSVDVIRSYFEQHAPVWDTRLPPDIDAQLRIFAVPLAKDFRTARTILEIGTGTGRFTPVLAELAPGASVLSVDLAGAMLLQARQRCPLACLLQADTHALPLPGGCCDLVVCHNSFPHFTDKPAALREIRRALRPGGRLLILHNLPRQMVNAIHRQLGPPLDGDLLPDGPDLERMLVSAGYTGVRIDDCPDYFIARGQRLA